MSYILAGILSERVRSRLKEIIADTGSKGREVRIIFHGPPLNILSQVFDKLIGDPDIRNVGVPILLQLPALNEGETNPPIGASGRCDENHLLDLRNAPTGASYLALIPPGQHAIRSVTSTTDEFGIGANICSGNVPFEDWWADAFIQSLLEAAIHQAGLHNEQALEARELVEHAARAADEIDAERISRQGAWNLLARIFSAATPREGLDPGELISLACGVPSTADSSLCAKDQIETLERLSDALADGFKSGIDRIEADASEADKENLGEFLQHIRRQCELPTFFERATAYFYAPTKNDQIENIPNWWKQLTVEKWSELLADEQQLAGDLHVECTNAILALPKIFPAIVKESVELQLSFDGQTPQSQIVTIERAPGKQVTEIDLSATASYEDSSPIAHKTPLRYKITHPEFRDGIAKAISLSSWSPGIVVACRQAKKFTHTKKSSQRGARALDWESSLTLPGPGRYEILLFCAPDLVLEAFAVGQRDAAGDATQETQELKVRTIRQELSQIEIDTDGNYQVDVVFSRLTNGKAAKREICRINISCREVAEVGCRSEYERLIRSNRRYIESFDAKAVVQIDRSARLASLQDWILAAEAVRNSFKPIVIAEDYEERWAQIGWESTTETIFSNARFIQDPRPTYDEFQPPKEFVDARNKIAARIRGDGDQVGTIEVARLGEWLTRDDEFRSDLEEYITSYSQWLSSDPDIACWVDVIAIVSIQADRMTLGRVPDAILLNPMHPLRLVWQACAQQVLLDADERDRPCPAGSVFDPDGVPDCITLGIRGPSGVDRITYLSVENSTDYWSVLWNGDQLRELPTRSRKQPFGDTFGVTVGGISLGFSAAQVSRAMEDVSELLAAKSTIGVAISSTGGTTDACNEGLINWCTNRFRSVERRPLIQSVGPKIIEIYDSRDERLRPEDALVANLTEDTKARVRWFEKQPQHVIPDLGIIAQLDMAEPSERKVENRSPIGQGGLLRHRIRRQLPSAFLSETRQSLAPSSSDDILYDKLSAGIVSIESVNSHKVGLQFAPNINAVREMLGGRKADFVAVSSSAIDPACFLGDWMHGAYLWDYDLPSYSHRAGDSNGYYLLAQIRDANTESLAKALRKLPKCRDIQSDKIQEILLEIARRGIPTIRGLSSNDSGATGDLGLFIAVRLLQDRFRVPNSFNSILDVIGDWRETKSISLIVSVDPFRAYIDDLAKTLRKDRKELTLNRPDLLVIGVAFFEGRIKIRLTPIEVKCRTGSIFSASEYSLALEQAKALSKLLGAMQPSEGQPKLWAFGLQHLLLSIIGFGMRVYSAQPDVAGNEAKWADLHESIAASILNDISNVEIDIRGRLIVIDDSVDSIPKDSDHDGFAETIVIGREDAAEIAIGDPSALYSRIRQKLGDWDFLPIEVSGAAMVVTISDSQKLIEAQTDLVKDELLPIPITKYEPAEIPVKPHFEPVQTSQDSGIILSVGRTVDGFQPRDIQLNISDTRLNQLNMGVVGDLGTGKTQILKSIITQISRSSEANRGIKPRFLIFDYKRDYSSADFVAATNARVVKPYHLPLNIFDTSLIQELAVPWHDRFRFFSDVLDKIYSGIGAVQRSNLKRAVQSAYDSVSHDRSPTLYDVHRAYSHVLDGKTDSPLSIIDDLVTMEIFSPDPSETFDAFLDGVVVISLDALGQDDRTKNMLVAVMLNMFYENMLRTTKKPFIGNEPQLRAIDSYLLVDEADNIMKYEFEVLKKLLLQGREFGTGVILASQYLRHFKVGATDYREPLLTWLIHKVPNVTAAELSGLGLTANAAEVAERVKLLPNHQCLYKSFDVGGEIIRGKPFFELMRET